MVDHNDSADAPLISNSQHIDRASLEYEIDEANYPVDLTDVCLLLEKNLKHPGFYVWLLTLSAGISGLLFGCKYPIVNHTAHLNSISHSTMQMIRASFLPLSSQSAPHSPTGPFRPSTNPSSLPALLSSPSLPPR